MKRIYLLFALITFLQACKKNGSDNVSIEDQLTDTQIQNIEAGGIDTTSKYQDAIFANGSNMSLWENQYDSGYNYIFNLRANPAPDKEKLFINSMTHAGFLLTTRSNYQNFSNQRGLAYVYNSKSFANPYTYPEAACQQALYGLDCSGMIYQMAKASGINIAVGGTADYVKTTTWNNAFNNSPDFQGLEMRDTGALAPAQIQAGDIIVAPSNHMGMVFANGATLSVFNSLGRSSYPCTKNSDVNHGPVISKNLSSWLQSSFGTNYHVLRVIQKRKNLIINGDFSSGNNNFSTNYTYCNSANCLFNLADNGYAIANDASTRHNSFVGKDHTNGNGLFMIINGAISTNVVWRQTVNVTANTNYDFESWICTLYAQDIADIIVKINGGQLGTSFTAPSSVNQWTKLSRTWNSGSNTSATIEIFSTKNIATGNDCGLDDISFK